MNPLIVRSWIEKNRKKIRLSGRRSVRFTPVSPIDFDFVAYQVALQVGKGTADMELFERTFWECYKAKLKNSNSLGNLFLSEEGGDLMAFVREV